MLAVLQNLIALQALDTAADAARKRLAELPAADEEITRHLATATAALDAIKARQQDNQQARRALEKDVAQVDTRLARFDDHKAAVKTNHEYTALLHEISTAKAEKDAIEERILGLMEAADGLTAELKAAQQALADATADGAKARTAIAAERQTLEAELARLAHERGARGEGRRSWEPGEVRPVAQAASRTRGRPDDWGGVRRLPRPASAAFCSADPPERRHRPVRQLPADPLLSAAGAVTIARYSANIDGGARGNPGPAGWGVVVQDPEGVVIAELKGTLPYATNNVAEYEGLLAALRWAADHGAAELHLRSDSLLLVQQMRGVYKVKNEGLKPLHGQARLLAHQIGRVTYEHVRRELNKDADRLANEAMDEASA